MSNLVIGIEGLVGSGKTSICRELIKKIPNSIILHGGNLYRGIIYSFMSKNKKINDNINLLSKNLKDIDITELMYKLNVEIKLENNETTIYVDGKKIQEEELQSDKSSMAVSLAGKSANNENLFLFARKLIDEWKKDYNVIVSGRSIMKIYPNLDYHFFITASLDERVNRKYNQYNGSLSKEELRAHIEKRDRLQQEAGFYEIYEKTIKLDVTDCISAKDSSDKLLECMKEYKITV